MYHMCKWTFEENHCLLHLFTCPSLLVSLFYMHWALSPTHFIGKKTYSFLPQALRHLLPLWRVVFPILFHFPLSQPFYLVGFHLLVISGKHHILREHFLKLLPSHKYHYRNILSGKFTILCRFTFLIETIWPSLSYLTRMETIRGHEICWFLISIIFLADRKIIGI